MFNQADIDAVLQSAQSAVDTLAREADALTSGVPSPESIPAASGLPPPPPPPPTPAPPVAAAPTADRGQRHSAYDQVRGLRVPVIVRVAERTMTMSEIVKLAPGSILEFDRSIDAELDLMVNNRQIGMGEAIKVGEHFGLQITRIGNAR